MARVHRPFEEPDGSQVTVDGYEERADPTAPKRNLLATRPRIEAFMLPSRVRVDADEAAAARDTYAAGDRPEDRRIADAYGALVDGRQLIDLRDTITRCYEDARAARLPKLAVARADLSLLEVVAHSDGDVEYRSVRRGLGRSWRLRYPTVAPGWQSEGRYDKEHPWQERAQTRVPLVPPQARRDNLSECLLVWEAQWRLGDHGHTHVIDPALLEHLVGDLYVVHHVWELTALEIAALSERAR